MIYYKEFELLHNVKPNPRNYVKDVKLIGRKIVLSPAEPSFFRLKLILFASDRKSQSQDMRTQGPDIKCQPISENTFSIMTAA